MSKAKVTKKKPGSLRGSADGRRTTAMRSGAEIAAFGRWLSDSGLTKTKIAESIRGLVWAKECDNASQCGVCCSRIDAAIAVLKLMAAVQSAAK